MCGLCGFVDFNKKSDQIILTNMISTLSHRGPDNLSAKIYDSQLATIGLAHARLSIIDLSVAANQPMNYKQFEIVFNGEIYNFEEIKHELIALRHTFELKSDTEVILHAYEQWGINCVEKFIGMFVIVIFDQNKNEVIFMRDRAGVKPLFVYQDKNLIVFGSELKAVIAHPNIKKSINNEAVTAYFKYSYIPAPLSIYKGITKFKSGNHGVFNISRNEFLINEYWNPYKFYAKEKNSTDSYKTAKDKVHELLKESINYRKIADVPIGVFLSGGYDSSIVAAILQKNSQEKIKTFTIGFTSGNNEAPFAKKIAKHLNTDHHEFYCNEVDALKIIHDLPFYYDEPFADSSAVPTIFVSKMAAGTVKVVISADGGDEVFFGYDDYNNIERYSNLLNKFNFKFTNKIVSISFKLLSTLYAANSFKKRKFEAGSKIFNTQNEFKDSIMFESYTTIADALICKVLKKPTKVKSNYKRNVYNFKDKMSMFLSIDYDKYLQGDMLTKVDRATMSQSIEGREPLLDHKLMEYCASLPTHYKYYNGEKKKILKDILFEYVPENIFQNKKLGFTIPIYDWLRSDLSILIDENLNEYSINETGIFNTKYILQLVRDFKNDHLPDNTIIWKLIIFQMWYKKWILN